MFRAAHRSSLGVPNRICNLWFIYTCGDRPLSRLSGKCVYKTEAANTVYSSWWWAVCRSKHVEPSINFGIINSITSCILSVFLWRQRVELQEVVKRKIDYIAYFRKFQVGNVLKEFQHVRNKLQPHNIWWKVTWFGW